MSKPVAADGMERMAVFLLERCFSTTPEFSLQNGKMEV
jgi:hypothetical protein